MKTILFRLLLIVGVFSFGTAAVRAEDLGAVKTRMTQRLAELDQFKEKGAIGENNRGLVELRDASPAAGDIVAAENRDRETVYAAIAQQQRVSVETVSRARAKQIASGSAAGVWIQSESGEWSKKK
ncbi:MAG: YdbL family protein [Undibacterium sp.]|nr:YdbL family protein [Opitutaceae bacterium]